MHKFTKACIISLLAGIFPTSLVCYSVANDSVVVISFGDSTTAPRLDLVTYSILLEEELNRSSTTPIKVINAGVRGDTTSSAALRLERDVLVHEADLVIIQFGINDSAYDVWKTPPAKAPRVPLSQFRENLQRFVKAVQTRGAKVILMTPNPLAWTPALLKQYGHFPYHPQDPDGFNVILVDYTAAVREVANIMKVPLVDVALAHAQHARYSTVPLLLDGIHPNNEGHRLVARLLCELIARHQLLPAIDGAITINQNHLSRDSHFSPPVSGAGQ